MQPLRSIEEAAGLLGISPWTVRSYIKAGKLKPIRIGRRVLLDEHELERFIGVNQASVGPNAQSEGINDEVRQ